MLTSAFLSKWWSKALRARVLYSSLDEEDRGYLWLTIKTVDDVTSAKVGKIILGILVKIREALKSGFQRHLESYGVERARKVSEQGMELGYDEAGSWMYDMDFIRYLTLLDYNGPPGFGAL